MRIQAYIPPEDFELLTYFCETNNVTVSGLLCTLLSDFLDTDDKQRVTDIVSRAQRIKQGRPKEGDY